VKTLIKIFVVVTMLAAFTAAVCGLAKYELNPNKEIEYEITK